MEEGQERTVAMSESEPKLSELTALRAEYNKLCDELRYQDAKICVLKEALQKIASGGGANGNGEAARTIARGALAAV